ncbi:MAG: mechanosensitive ion channel [Chromatiales bacterium]|nr:mechanosensitive ion channel [Chromatiales bacterium]
MRPLTLMIPPLLLAFLLLCPPLLNAEETTTPPPANGDVAAPSDDVITRLTQLREQQLNHRQEMEALRKELATTKSEERKAHIEQRLTELPKSIEALNRSFEQVALGGIDMAVFSEQQEEQFDWKEELLEITRPLIGSLKEITEKPRKIEQIRQLIERQEQQLGETERALSAIEALNNAKPSKEVTRKLKDMTETWQQRQHDLKAGIELAHYQLAVLHGETRSVWGSIGATLNHFFKGRGLTLLIAVVALLLVWLLAHLLRTAGHRLSLAAARRKGRRHRRKHAIHYLYRTLTSLAMVVTLLIVFYLRNDLMLLALTLIVVVMLGLTLRQTLPKYVREVRTLLDFGSVREGERVIYNGLPLRVGTVNAFTTLRNPELEGFFRLPLATLSELISRPGDEEEWFPCRVGEFLMLPDERIAEVERLTLEYVQLRRIRSTVQINTSEFLGTEFRNLSRNGFAIPTTFGIDYRHQAICLDEVPQKMKIAVEEALRASPWAAYVSDLLVEFKEAGANSLDYIIYLTMSGEAAGNYYIIARLVQQSLVRLCNREEWVIPFAQLTLHQGEGFEALHTPR